MAQSVGGVYIPLDLSTGKFNAKLTEADRKLTAFSRSVNLSMSSMVGLGAITFGAGIVTAAAKVNLELAETAKLAREVGLSFDRIQEVKFAALTNGVSESGFTSGLQNLAKLIEEAQREENSLGKLFEANNVKLKDRHGQIISVNDALAKGADLIKNAQNGAAKVEIAQMLGLSREWVKTLEGGGAAFQKTADGAKDAGAVIDASIIAKAETFEKQWVQAMNKWSLAAKAAAAELMPDLLKLADLAISVAQSIGRWVSESVIAEKMNQGLALSVRELEYSIALAQKRGSLVDPSWIAELERLRAAQVASNRETEKANALVKPDGPRTVIPSREVSTTPKGFDSILISGRARIAALQAEQAAFGLTTAAAAKLRIETELLSNAERRGIELTPERRRQISELASEFGNLASSISTTRERYEYFNDIASAGGDALKGFAQDLLDGKKSSDALADALKRLQSRILDLTLDAALSPLTKGLGNIFGGLFGGGGPSSHYMMGNVSVPLFREGGLVNIAHAPKVLALADGGGPVRGPGTGTSDSIPARLSNGEFVVNAAATSRHRPLLEAINSGISRKAFAPTVPAAFANGGFVGMTKHVFSPAFAKGGVVGMQTPSLPDDIPPRMRAAAAWQAFAGAPGGGDGGGGNTVVNIYNQTGAQVEQRRSRDANGNERVDIYLKEAVRGIIREDMAKNGPIAGDIGSRFGLNSVRGIVG